MNKQCFQIQIIMQSPICFLNEGNKVISILLKKSV